MVIKKTQQLKRSVSDGYRINLRRFVMQGGSDIADLESGYYFDSSPQDFSQGSYHFDYQDQDTDINFIVEEVEVNAEDVYSQLAQKEKYLLLAAEAGKRLLDEKSELQQKYEMLREEYSQKLEVQYMTITLA